MPPFIMRTKNEIRYMYKGKKLI